MNEDVNLVDLAAASILHSALQTAQCYMSADSSCISNCVDVHSYTECCYRTVNC